MSSNARRFDAFPAGFALAFVEEIQGEGFFAALAEAESDPRRSRLWRRLVEVERATVNALRPLARAQGLLPMDEAAERLAGREEAEDWVQMPWTEVMALIVRDFPVYLDEFDALRRLAPAEAQWAAQILHEHELAILDMARTELSGKGDAEAPISAYLARLAALDRAA